MADRVHPSAKQPANGHVTASNGPTAATNGVAIPPPATKIPQRAPYRPQPQYNNHRRRRGRSGRSICCCCCFWLILAVLALALLAAIAGAAVYVLYRPHQPQFTVTSLRVARLNLTTASDSSSSRLAALANVTVVAKNPNNHLTFFYDAFSVTLLSAASVPIANASVPAFVSDKKNETTLRTVVAAAATDLDAESTTSLRSDLKKRGGVPMKIVLDTSVKVKMESFRSKKVGIRVICDGFKAPVPKSKSPTVVSVAGAKCRVDLRIKIWKWTY